MGLRSREGLYHSTFSGISTLARLVLGASGLGAEATVAVGAKLQWLLVEKLNEGARALAITPSASTTVHEQERDQFEGRGSWSVGDPVQSHTGSNVPCGKPSSGTAGAYIKPPPSCSEGRWELQQPLKRSESAQKTR